MVTYSTPDLLLLGAGHCHLQLLAQLIKLGQNAPRSRARSGSKKKHNSTEIQGSTPHSTQVLLIDRGSTVWYSGFFSAFLYEEINQDQMVVDLAQLCLVLNRYSNSLGLEFSFCQAEAVSWDLENHLVKFSNGWEVKAGALSINLGAPLKPLPTPKNWSSSIALGAKPLARLVTEIEKVSPGEVMVIGAGATGIELVLGIQHYVQQQNPSGQWTFSLVFSSALLAGWPLRAQKMIGTILLNRGVKVLDQVPEDPPGIVINATGFFQPQPLAVDSSLRVLNYPKVYGAGDGISVEGLPPVYGGVYPVRQGLLLLRSLVEDQIITLAGFHCKKNHRFLTRVQDGVTIVTKTSVLQIINLGSKPYALGRWKGIVLKGWLLKTLKHRIDQNFMNQFIG